MPGSELLPENWPGWPEGKKFALVLTHDVEGPVGLARCRELMKLDMTLGVRSSFNFIPEGRYRVPRRLRDELLADGFEVGIHDLRHDGRLFASRRAFDRNAFLINSHVREWGAAGFRSGFMLHNLDWLHELNIEYDASTFDTDPFEPQPEGRHTIFPFWVPRLSTAENGGLKTENGRFHTRALSCEPAHSAANANGYVELPYTLPQDSTLFLLLGEKTADIWKRKLDWIAEHGGMALFITHPDYMAFSGGQPRQNGEYPVDHYIDLLEHVRSRYAGQYWQALPKEVAAFVRQNISKRASVSGKAIFSGNSNRAPLERLRGKRAGVLLFSYYPADPRPRRAAEALARAGVAVDVICLRNQGQPRRETVNGVRVFRVPLKRYRSGTLRYLAQYSAFILRAFFFMSVRSLIRRYDLVHVHNMPDALVFSAAIPKALGAKIILDLHDPMPELMQTIFNLPPETFTVRLLKCVEKWSIHFADLVLTVNLACKRIYSSRSCPPEKINVVLNTPEDDVFRFQPANRQATNGKEPTAPFVILYHGSLVPRNGLDLAVDALEATKKSVPTAKLVVCGERSAFFDSVMGSVRQRGLEKNVDYLGVKDRQEIVEAINRCDLGIIPNHRNSFTDINTPTRIFEYLARGKPVIAPRTQGIRDYFVDNDLIFFRPGDAADLAEKIEFAFNNPDKVGEIVERGQQVYLAHGWPQEKSNFLNSVAELL